MGKILYRIRITVAAIYQKGDLSQVNPRLYEWLATINEKSPADSIAQERSDVTPSDEHSEDSAYRAGKL